MSTRPHFLVALAGLAVILASSPITAQRQGRGRQGAPAQRPRASARTNQVDPEVMRESMMQRMQQQLGASAAEWQVIAPRLQEVMDLSRQLDSPGRNRRAAGGTARAQGQAGQARRERGPQLHSNADRPPSAVQRAADELQQLLGDSSATPERIKARLATLRQSRAAVMQELARARAQLQGVLTIEQEATLVLRSILE